jgi:hypothetical protein
MNGAVMGPAQRHGEFVADLAAQRPRLGKLKMVGIGWPPARRNAARRLQLSDHLGRFGR